MAKSLRSKWRRKMKAEKRVRYGEKELQRLKDMLTEAGDYQMVGDGEGVAAAEGGGDSEGAPTRMDESVKIPINSVLRPQRKKSRENKRYNNDAEAAAAAPTRSRKKSVSNTTTKSRRSRLDDFQENRDDDDEDEDAEMMMEDDDDEDATTMSVDKQERVFSKRTMRDQFGNYPAWMNKRKMTTQKKKNKRITKRRAMSVAGKRVRKGGK